MSTDTSRLVELTEKDLPLHCPLPAHRSGRGIRAYSSTW